MQIQTVEEKKINNGKKVFSIGIGSVDGGVGKTFIACNLAKALGILGIKTIIYDANLNSPSCLDHFTLPKENIAMLEKGKIVPIGCYDNVKVFSPTIIIDYSKKYFSPKWEVRRDFYVNTLYNLKITDERTLIIDFPPLIYEDYSFLLKNVLHLILVCDYRKNSMKRTKLIKKEIEESLGISVDIIKNKSKRNIPFFKDYNKIIKKGEDPFKKIKDLKDLFIKIAKKEIIDKL